MEYVCRSHTEDMNVHYLDRVEIIEGVSEPTNQLTACLNAVMIAHIGAWYFGGQCFEKKQ